MIRVFILSAFIVLGGCATDYTEKRDKFVSECIAVENASYSKCLYIEYNSAVTSINKVIARKYNGGNGTISTKTKDGYKEKIVDLNAKVDQAYKLGDVADMRDHRKLLDVLRKYLEDNLDSQGQVQL